MGQPDCRSSNNYKIYGFFKSLGNSFRVCEISLEARKKNISHWAAFSCKIRYGLCGNLKSAMDTEHIDPFSVVFERTELPKTVVLQYPDTDHKNRAGIFHICLRIQNKNRNFERKQHIGRVDGKFYSTWKSAHDDIINWRMRYEGYIQDGARWISPPSKRAKLGLILVLNSNFLKSKNNPT